MVLVGTAHISAASVQEVKDVIAREAPSVVCVELDENRFRALTEPDRWKQTKLVDVIKQGKAFLLLAQAFLGSYQRRLGDRFGVQPGAEMLAAIDDAKERGAELVLADRDIGVTMKRAWGRMGLREKFRVMWEFMKALTGAAELKDADKELLPEDLLKEDALSLMMEELSAFAPSVSDVLVKERDAYLAGRIRDAAARSEGTVVAVIGAGHLKGVEAHLRRPEAIPPAASLESLPKKFPVGQAIAWGVLALVVASVGWLLYQGFVGGEASCLQNLQDLALQWVLITGTFSAIGAAAAFAHPASIAVAFIAAPFATIHPLVATGWFSGITEAVVRQPRVQDYESLSKLTSIREFWRNRVTRVLLVAALTNIGAMTATFWLLPRVLGGFAC